MTEPEITEQTNTTAAKADAATNPAVPAPEAAPVDLAAQLTAAKAEAAANLERFMRSAADLENFRRRTVREKEELRLFATSRVLEDLLPVLDNLGLAVAAANPTLNDILLFAVSRVLKNHRACNAHFFDDRMVYFNRVHLGMAVDTPRGLMVPTIFNADLLDLAGIAREARTVADACQKGTVVPDQLKGGTFTLTNLGTLGIESFTPVINPPQTCILGVNTLVTRVKDVDGRAVPYQAMTLSLTFDHRALDGAPAARFLKDLKAALENFPLLLMK